MDILAWTGKDKTMSMGFTVAVPAAGEIGPSGEFVKGGSSAEWNNDTADVSTPRMIETVKLMDCQDPDSGLVVFFTGVFLKYRWQIFGQVNRTPVVLIMCR